MNYYLGIDIGTSGTKAICYDTFGNPLKELTITYPLYQEKKGYAEQNPLDWYNATKSLILRMNCEFKTIKGIGLSGQMHGLVLLDKNDKILRKSIIWCDNRADKEKEEIERVIGSDKLKEITGNEAMAPFTLAKLLWVKNNEPQIYKQISKVLLPKDYVKYMLTGAFKTEYSDASGMQMLDIKNKCYSKEILSKFEIDLNSLPQLEESVDIAGYLKADEYGELKDIFVVGGASDQAASALGNGIINSNQISLVLGSSGVVFKPIKKDKINSNIPVQIFMHAIKDTYHMMGVTNGCGLSYSWFKNSLCQNEIRLSQEKEISVYDILESELKSVESGSEGLIYLPYINGERTPHNDTFATGSFLGIRPSTTKPMFTRAVIEGICYSLRDCYELFPKASYEVFISGGGAKSNTWVEILATNLKNKIKFNNVTEAGTLGVAILAMVAGKEFLSIEEAIEKIICINKEILPKEEKYVIYDQYFSLFKEAYQSLKKYYVLQKELEERL